MPNQKIKQLTTSDFKDFITNSEIPCLIDFWAPWCSPCKMLSPVIDEIADDYEGRINVCKVNIDEEFDISSEYAIMTIPTVALFSSGEIIERSIGAVPKDNLIELIESFFQNEQN